MSEDKKREWSKLEKRLLRVGIFVLFFALVFAFAFLLGVFLEGSSFR